jgi:hypothetical protein
MKNDFITYFHMTNISIFAMSAKQIHISFGVRSEDHFKEFQ